MANSESKGSKTKSDTIKKRSIYVYLPSIETVNRWKNLASKENTSVSKFVFEHVENSLSSSENIFNRVNLLDKVKEVDEENKQLRKENRLLNKAIENLEEELKSFRMRPFVSSKYEGIGQYDQNLINLLKKRGVVRSDEILGILGIDPMDSKNVKAVMKQLENLESYGLVKAVPGGWRWVKK